MEQAKVVPSGSSPTGNHTEKAAHCYRASLLVEGVAVGSTLTTRGEPRRQAIIARARIWLPRMMPRGLHTDEDTISLLRRLAVHYPDDVIAGIFNRQGRKTANRERFTANQVGSLRRYRNIPRYEPPAEPPTGPVVPIRQAAQILGINTSTVHRWLNDGFIAGEQVTPGAPWQIRVTDELRARFVEQAPPGYLLMLETTMSLVKPCCNE